MRKICTKCVPRVLNEEQNANHWQISKHKATEDETFPRLQLTDPFRDMKSSSSRLFASNIEYGTRCWTSISTTRLHGTQPYVIQPIQMIKLTTNMIIIINGNNQYLVYTCLSNLDEVSLYISGSSSHYVKIVSVSQKLLFFC